MVNANFGDFTEKDPPIQPGVTLYWYDAHVEPNAQS